MSEDFLVSIWRDKLKITDGQNMRLTSALGRPRKYHFDKLKAGESQFVPCDNGCGAKFQRKISTLACRMIGKGNYTTRRIALRGADGVIVHRKG